MSTHSGSAIARQFVLASTALLLATWSPAQVSDDLYQQALAQWQSGELATARRSLEESIRASDDRWEKHRDLAQILLELGDLEAARAELERAKSGLDAARRTIADREAWFLARAESLLAEAKADLAAGNTRRAGEKLAQIAAIHPELPGLSEIRDAIPVEFLPQLQPTDERRLYIDARRRLIGKSAADIRSSSPKDLVDWIQEIPATFRDESLDDAQDLLQADDRAKIAEGRRLLEAYRKRVASIDYEQIYMELEEAERRDDADAFFALAKQAAPSSIYAPLVRRKLEVRQDREPQRVVEVLMTTNAAGDGDSWRVLEGIWVRFADRLRPLLPALDEAARAGAWDRFVDLMAANGPVVDPEFEALRQQVRDGRASEASARLQAILTRMQRLARGGPLDVPKAIKGRKSVTSHAVPTSMIEPKQSSKRSRWRFGLGLGGGSLSYADDGPGLDDSASAYAFRMGFEGTSRRRGLGGGMRLERFDADALTRDGSPTNLNDTSLFGHFTYRVQGQRFGMPVRIGPLLNVLRKEDEDGPFGDDTNYWTYGARAEIAPELTLAQSDRSSWRVYSEIGLGAGVTKVEVTDFGDTEEWSSSSLFTGLELGTRVQYGVCEISIAYVGRWQSMGRTGPGDEGSSELPGYDAGFNGVMLGFAVVF